MQMPKVPLWAKLVISSLIFVVVANFAGVAGVKTSVYLGLFFLVLTLLPIHFKKLVRYRRDFGITSGVLILLHGALAFSSYLDLSYSKLFGLPIIGGYIGSLVLVVMLVTSVYLVQRKLKNAWRAIHACVWFVLPLALMHANTAAQAYVGETPTLALVTLGGLSVFGIFKFAVSRTNLRESLRDAVLVLAGMGFNMMIWQIAQLK